MPRFYLHTRSRYSYVHDDEGLELPDLNSAKTAAVKALSDEPPADPAAVVQVADADGLVLMTVSADSEATLLPWTII